MRLPLSFAAASLLVAPSLGQGADLCSAAQAISGAGPHAFDTTAAGTDGSTTSCGEIFNDVWYSFTAADSVDHIISLCAGATHDSKIAVYDGSCAGLELACNDDACGPASEATFPAVSGQTYIVRIGNFADGSGGAGTFTIQPDLPIVNPVTGHAYKVVTEFLDWNSARSAAEASLYQGENGHLVTFEDQAELDWVVANVPFQRPWIGLFHDTTAPSYSEPSGGWTWVTGELATNFNWFPGEPNDTSASGGAEDYAEMFTTGEWNDAELFHSQTNQYLVEWDGGLGTTYCNPAVPNTTGLSGVMQAMGSATASDNNLTLAGSNLPLNQFAIFINGMAPGFVPNPGGSQGVLCIIGAIGRYNKPSELQNTGTSGAVSLALNLNDTPTPTGPVSIMSGQTWYFQLWYRDWITGQGATSNFTDAIEITFQ